MIWVVKMSEKVEEAGTGEDGYMMISIHFKRDWFLLKFLLVVINFSKTWRPVCFDFERTRAPLAISLDNGII